MRAELEPFDIKVTVVEPGYFRTGFLNDNAQISSAARLKVYDETKVGEIRAGMSYTNGKQIGDVAKGSKVVVDVLTHTGLAEGRDVPMRIAVGSDAPAAIWGKLQATEVLLAEWDSITTGTDHE